MCYHMCCSYVVLKLGSPLVSSDAADNQTHMGLATCKQAGVAPCTLALRIQQQPGPWPRHYNWQYNLINSVCVVLYIIWGVVEIVNMCFQSTLLYC